MQKWALIWQLASDYGSDPTTPLPERKRIRLTNQSSCVLALLILCYAVAFGTLGPSPLGWITLGMALLFAWIPLLQRRCRGDPRVRYFFLCVSYLSIFVYSLLLGPDSGIHLFFISAIVTPFILLDVQRTRFVLLFCLLPLGLLFALELYFHDAITPLPLSAEALRIIYLMMLPSVALTTFLYSGYFYLINQTSERELQRTILDVNRSKKLIEDQQQQLASASRLSAIGELSGSIAHEINNPLTIIMGHTELIARIMRSEEPNRERVLETCDRILKTTGRITKIVVGLKKLAREGADDPLESACLKDIIEDASSVCMESLQHLGIELRVKAPSQPCLCLCRPLQLSQVLLNLIQNAKDSVQSLETRWIEIEVKPMPTAFVILVRDSGVILDADVRDRIGQPFFTTKPPGKGTGLGLSISRKIIAHHGGSIEFDKEASSTTFVMQLPREAQTV